MLKPITVPVLLFLASLATALAYWPGVGSDFVLDDIPNLSGLSSITLNDGAFWSFVFGNESGVFGRPVSMFSFALNYLLYPSADAFAFKSVNLLLHLLNGYLAFTLAALVFGRYYDWATSRWYALSVAVLWLLSPLHSSTVLYVIQRMAMLSTLFSLLGMICYMRGRLMQRVPTGDTAWVWLLAAFICIPLAVFSKENGALLPLYYFLLEVFVLQFRVLDKYSLPIVGVYCSGFLLAVCLLIYVLSGDLPGFLQFGHRPFTMLERLLTEQRIIWLYIREIVLPSGIDWGLYHDDIELSRGLSQPLTTLAAFVGLLVLALGGVVSAVTRKGLIIGLGISFFLAAHLLESSVIALELYFEHRNYLASMGVWMALVGVMALVLTRLDAVGAYRHYLVFAIVLYGMLQFFIVRGEALLWANPVARTQVSALKHPESFRANTDWAFQLVEQGQVDQALRIFDRFEIAQPKLKDRIEAQRLLVYCLADMKPPESAYQLDLTKQYGIDLVVYNTAWSYFLEHKEKIGCDNVEGGRIASTIDRWIDSKRSQGLKGDRYWSWEYIVLRLYEIDKAVEVADAMAKKYAMAGSVNVSFYRIQMRLNQNDTAAAERLLAELKQSYTAKEMLRYQSIIAGLENELAESLK